MDQALLNRSSTANIRLDVNYPEVDIINEIRVKAYPALLAFKWRYLIRGGDELELNDNDELKKVPKAPRHIRICSGYLDCGLGLPFSFFIVIVQNYKRVPSHFYYILSM